ncbi:alpha/beta fold hydrolase [Roseateles cellulosilyticus]|uniref:Alpha/beta hydrolase n=1 Tax=Pelomonas cellulosilytica TaxID=2906762 RepID=A0ABS8XVT3_9BURK|nr:alpha/beta hydrolase [Pelomonas sp. P8]MCE4554997.1 alpha/beta hydrolase [Pelomonas sp. P8]
MATHAREGWIHSDGLRLRYVEWGPTDAPAVVALHGLRSFAYTWEPVALPLADRFRIIALDQRGRGESDWDPERRYYTADYVRDLEALVDRLSLPRFVLLGHSMGGSNALVYAGSHAEHLAGLVIEDMGPGASAGGAGAQRIRRELLATPSRFAGWDEAAGFWRSQRPNVTDAAIAARVRHSMKQVRDGSVVWRHDAEGIAASRLAATPQQLVDLWPHVLSLRIPTLLLRGARSDFLTAETASAMVQRNPVIRRVEIPDASHYVHDDNLPAFEAALQAYLSDPALAAWAKGGAR